MSDLTNSTGDIVWDVQSLRVSVFVDRPPAPREDIWLDFAGNPPEVQELRARESITRYTGPFLNGSLQLLVTPVRIDLVLGARLAVQDSQSISVPELTVGPATQIVAQYRERISKFIASFGAIKRIAVAGSLWAEGPTRAIAYAKLSSLLKSVEVDSERARELLFRINWRVPSKSVPGQEINRVTTWSATEIRALLSADASPGKQLFERTFVQFDFDINNVPSVDVIFSSDSAQGLSHELLDLLEENMREGEVMPS